MADDAGKGDVRGNDRIVLYKRKRLKNPKARIKVPNATGYKIVPTKTDDVRDAERFAANLYEEPYMRVQMGTSVEMLEKFYGPVVTSTLASEITKGRRAENYQSLPPRKPNSLYQR